MPKRMSLLAVCAALCAANLTAQEPSRVIPVYLVPRDYQVPLAGVAYHVKVMADVRSWYARVLAGRTFVAEPLVVQVSRHSFAELAADQFQAWWPLLQNEFAAYGWPWNAHSRFKLLFLTHGAGAWAGSDSENGGIDSVAQAGKVDKGDWGGLAVIGDSSVGGVLAGVCPETAHGKSDSTKATAWWCSGSTYRGTVAHELGHTFGLPHPDAFRPGFRCADSTAYTIMQCHWWWEKERLLDYEIGHLRSLSFFQFDTAPTYALLPLQRPQQRKRVRTRALERGDSLVWTDGRGGGTGYPWALMLEGAGADVTYGIEGGRLAFDLGVARGGRGTATIRIDADARPLAQVDVTAGHPPQRIVLDLGAARRLRIRCTAGTATVVLGNIRVYAARRAEHPSD